MKVGGGKFRVSFLLKKIEAPLNQKNYMNFLLFFAEGHKIINMFYTHSAI
jgi:hypothetical protein